jgi:hypothetical protein
LNRARADRRASPEARGPRRSAVLRLGQQGSSRN